MGYHKTKVFSADTCRRKYTLVSASAAKRREDASERKWCFVCCGVPTANEVRSGVFLLVIDKLSRKSIHDQIVEGIEREILAGVLPVGAKLPSVRELSVSLCVNPNTVQKALSALDSAGVIISTHGRGSFVAENAAEKIKSRSVSKLESIRTLAAHLAGAGISAEDIRSAVELGIKDGKE